MRFINQRHVPFRLRRPHLERYRRMLRESLHNPGLAQEQREYIKAQLAQAGQPKVYGPEGKIRPSSLDSSTSASSSTPEAPIEAPTSESGPEPESQEPLPDEAALNRMTKAEIKAQAASEGIEGVSARQLKAEMIETLLAGRA